MKTIDDLRRSHAGARVLLADGSLIHREVLVELLQQAGLVVEVAETGTDALDKVKKRRPDLLLVDTLLPELSALDLARTVRAMPGLEAIPIIAMTPDPFGEDPGQARAAGITDHIVKPVDPQILCTILLNWLPQQTPARFAAAPPLAAAGPDQRSQLDQIPGLDAAAGLRYLGDRVASYVRLLRRFADEHGDDVAKLRTSIAAGDTGVARSLAHALKGVAGTLGAVRLQDLMTELENLLVSGRTEGADALCETAQREMELLRDAIHHHLGG
jgi:two-component system, sensor histidine kinase and response regulator